MALLRDRPFSQFNFLVSWDGLDPQTPQAGFQEVTGLGMEITVAEYRGGNEKDNAPRKINGTYKVPDVTLKRGVLGADDLYLWLNQVRDGSQDALKTVTVELLAEDRGTTASTWVLSGARPIKYTGPSLNGKGTDIAIEELVLSCERIDLRFQ